VTYVRRGVIDHSDSLGAAARFGAGDTQWLTAGRGIVHSEMFPLLQQDQPNPVELFQIWLNLPSKDKLVEPHFSMLWDKTIPRASFLDEQGRETQVTVIAGRLGDAAAPPPPPHSWASRADADVAIWSLRLAPKALFSLPPTLATSVRTLYFFKGTTLLVNGERLTSHSALQVRSDQQIVLENGSAESELLMLQGRPIAEPVARCQHQDRRLVAAATHGLHQSEAVAVGQTEIHDGGVEFHAGQCRVGIGHGGTAVDGETAVVQGFFQEFRETVVVFDQEETHFGLAFAVSPLRCAPTPDLARRPTEDLSSPCKLACKSDLFLTRRSDLAHRSGPRDTAGEMSLIILTD